MKFRIITAHFGSAKPWDINPTSKQNFSFKYYDDNSLPGRENAMHPRLKAKIPKMLEWRFYKADWYIWMDSSIQIKKNADLPELVLKTANGNPLCLFKHSKLQSIKEEGKLIKRKTRKDLPYFHKRFSGEPIISQTEHYLRDKKFKDDKLFQMTFFAYHHSARSLMQEWFMQNCIWSIKDQLSFPYVLAKSGFSYSLFPGTVAENDHFDWCWKERESSLTNT